MSNTQNHNKVVRLTTLGVLTAVLVLMAFTPLGYMKVGAIEITFNMIPVVIGAIIVGPVGGAILGGVFGITSFIQCFGMSAFGTFLMTINPVLTFIMCLVPRILAGFLAGLVFRGLNKIDRTGIVSFCGATVSGALFNTIFFMLSILVFFWNNNTFISEMTGWGLPVDSFGKFLAAFVGVNGLIEAGVCFVVGAALSKALSVVISKKTNA